MAQDNHSKTDLALVILAAGQGTRMQSKKQKILHAVGGAPMIMHVYKAAVKAADHRPVIVIGPGGERVRELIGNGAEYVVQAEQLGTGHATLTAADRLRGKSGQVMVTYADMPLLRAETMRELARRQAETGATLAMLSTLGETDSSFGRVVRDQDGRVTEIVEVAEARQRPNAAELLAIHELNVGVYCFAAGWLWEYLPHLPPRQARSGEEYYLTDLVEAAVSQGRRVETIVLDDPQECLGAGTRAELVDVEKAFRRRAYRYWLARGVTLVDPESTYIDQTVTIGQDTVIWPDTYLQGDTHIGADCVIGPNAILRDAKVGAGCRIEWAVVESSELKDGSFIPAFTHLRQQTHRDGTPMRLVEEEEEDEA